jgi:hypothetical protein
VTICIWAYRGDGGVCFGYVIVQIEAKCPEPEYASFDRVGNSQTSFIAIGRRVGILRRGEVESCPAFVLEQRLLSLRVNGQGTDEANLLTGEFNGILGQREQLIQQPQTYDRIQYSN